VKNKKKNLFSLNSFFYIYGVKINHRDKGLTIIISDPGDEQESITITI